MSDKQLTGTLEGTLDGTLDERFYSAMLGMSGELSINEQPMAVTLRGHLMMPDGGVQPSQGIQIGNLVLSVPDADQSLSMRIAIHGAAGEFVTSGSDDLFKGIDAGSFIFEKGAPAADETLPIKMIFQDSSTVETNQLKGQFALVARTHRTSHSFKERVEIELSKGNVVEKHQVWLEGEVSMNQPAEGTLKFQSDQGELGVSLVRGNLQGMGVIEFDWRQLWATGIFRGSKRGSLWLRASMHNVSESQLEFRLE